MDSHRPAYFACLLKFLRNKGRSREDAEDLIQEAMLRLYVYAKDDAVVNEEAFLRHAAHNLAIDQYRRDRLGLLMEVPIEDVDRQSPLIAQGPTPDQILETRQCLDDVAGLLDALNPRTREIYFACRAGYTYAEIADDLRIAETTVKRHMARAKLTIMMHVESRHWKTVRATPHRHVKCARLGRGAEAPRTCERCFQTVVAAAARSDSDPSGLEPAVSHSQAR
jgi:RNA polymerase sigma factor (sigma-70 family)